mmetsp:Transcript_14546/g.33415  ORF Transcript_14546/g.33415 Transcript_14546/m.33415 type:complete len:100 (+) Transcript_14546:239-538(+)
MAGRLMLAAPQQLHATPPSDRQATGCSYKSSSCRAYTLDGRAQKLLQCRRGREAGGWGRKAEAGAGEGGAGLEEASGEACNDRRRGCGRRNNISGIGNR